MSRTKLSASLVAITAVVGIILFVIFLTPSNSVDQKKSEIPNLRTDTDVFSYTTEPEPGVSDNEEQRPSPSQGTGIFPEKTQIGVHASSNANLTAFEESIERSADIVAVHIHWGNENTFPVEFGREVLKRGATLMVFWNPMDYTMPTDEQEPFHYRHILDGSWDEYIDDFVQESQKFPGHIVIAPLEEMNGEWTPWSGYRALYGSRDDYIRTFQYLHSKFDGVQNVEFAWVVNNTSVPNTQTNSKNVYYPGDDYVDVIGINSFNFGNPWTDFDTLVEESIKELYTYNKPLYITSVASAEGVAKAEWIHNFFTSRFFSDGPLRGFIWFNEDKERNWTIWSDEDSLSAFKEGVRTVDL